MNGAMLNKLDESIGLENDPWHDPNREHAWTIVGKLSECEWKSLKQLVRNKPSYWQERCADSVSISSENFAIEVLKEILISGSFDAAAIAANVLADENIGLSIEYEEKLRNIAKHFGEDSPVTRDVEQLISSIKNPI